MQDKSGVPCRTAQSGAGPISVCSKYCSTRERCRSTRLVLKVWLTPGSIGVAADRLEKKGLVKRKNTDDRRVRLVELTAKGRAATLQLNRIQQCQGCPGTNYQGCPFACP